MYNVYHRLPLPSTTNLVKLPITQFPGNNKRPPGAILGDLSLWLSRFSRLFLFEIEIEAELTEVNHSEPKYVSALTQSPTFQVALWLFPGLLAFASRPPWFPESGWEFHKAGGMNAERNHEVHRSWNWKPAWEMIWLLSIARVSHERCHAKSPLLKGKSSNLCFQIFDCHDRSFGFKGIFIQWICWYAPC